MHPAPAADRLLIRLWDLLGDRFEFRALLGEGGSGIVYEVRNLQLDRLEAVKVLSGAALAEQAFERFVQEAKVAAALVHPHIVPIHTFGQEQGLLWYAMQLMDGPSLADLLETGLRFDPAMFARLALPILDALAYSHGRGVIHRDLKPANILFDRHGQPYLADFGLAKTDEDVLRTRTGHLLGTPAYVAPEQALGQRVDARADQYALGVTFYRVLTGHLPFSAGHVLETLVQRLREDPVPIRDHRPDLDPGLAELVMRTLARDREERWSDIAHLRQALLDRCREAGWAWDGPLAEARTLAPRRQPLPDLGRAAPPAGQGSLEPTGELAIPAGPGGSLEPTADLPGPARPPHPAGTALPRGPRTAATLAWTLLVALALLAGLGVRRSLGRRPAAVPATAPPATGPTAPAAQVPAAPSIPGPADPSAPGPATPSGPAAQGGARPAAAPAPALARVPVTYPQLVGTPEATTPATACAGLRVNVSLRVGADGRVKACKVLSAVPPECAEAARVLAMGYQFRPARDAQGEPLESTVAAAVDFQEQP